MFREIIIEIFFALTAFLSTQKVLSLGSWEEIWCFSSLPQGRWDGETTMAGALSPS